MLWPDAKEGEKPISHITSGIHLPTWIAPEMSQLYREYLGADWLEWHDDPRLWEQLMDIPDDELWAVRQLLKRKLIDSILERGQRLRAEGYIEPQQLPAMGATLNPEALTIAFARPFAEYQRPGLILQDAERLGRLLNDQQRPVQIIFAGKSHPSDSKSKYLIREVYASASSPGLEGHIAFLVDYDMYIARHLVQGVDIWLNNPRRMHQPSGTSGMKACINGVIHLSILDGWWQQGFNGVNGWAITNRVRSHDPREEDRADAEALYHLLEYSIVPIYYDQDSTGVSHRWIRIVKEAIRSVAPIFCTRRMLREYVQYAYSPIAHS